ncbi:MAG: MopE-related protein [Candidatus Peribacteraceae bacterium]
MACEAPAGFVSRDADCDDDDPAVNPDAVEVCDGVDNDCDDEVDVDDAGDLVTQACYEGLPPETEGIGVCRGGIETCQAGGTFGPCLGQVIPSDELAGNLVDEDCDGLLDGLDPSCVNCCTEAEGPRDCSDLDLACEVGVCDVVSGICTTEWSDLCCTDADGPDTQCTEMFPDANPDVPDYLWGCEIGATEDNPGFCTTCRDSDGLWDCGVEVCANDLDEDGDGEVDEAGCVECTSTSDCLAGEVCNLVTNVCEVPADCTFDTDCVDVPAAVCDGDDNVITFRGLCGADGSCTYPESTTRMVCDFGCALGECLPECDAASDCNDGLFCTGTETCNAGGLCVAGGGNPCLVGTPYCVEASDSCVECTADAHCGADEFCSAGVCTPTIGATELRVTWTNASTPEAPVGTTLRLQMACFNATGGSVISWGVYATGPRDAASITAVVDFNGAAWCKVNIVAVNAFGVGVWWAAQADALGAPDISGVLSYLLGTRAVTSVTTRPNSETCSSGGYDWAFWPGTDSDGDKVCDGAAPAAPPFCTPAAPPFCAAGPDPTPNG